MTLKVCGNSEFFRKQNLNIILLPCATNPGMTFAHSLRFDFSQSPKERHWIKNILYEANAKKRAVIRKSSPVKKYGLN